jgi:hypothetical protein
VLAAFDVPADDRFRIVSTQAPSTEIVRPLSYLGIEYSDERIIIRTTCSDLWCSPPTDTLWRL